MISFIRRNTPSPPILKLFLFTGLVWAAVVGPTSAVLILVNAGAASRQIGIVTALCAVAGMAFQPVFGYVSDKIGSPRKVLAFCISISAVFFGLVLLSESLPVVAVLLILESMFRSAVVPLLDSHILSETKAMPGLQYSHIRMAGSITFGSISFYYSFVISDSGVTAIIPISIGITCLAVFWGLLMAKGRSEAPESSHLIVKKAKSHLRRDAAALFANKAFVMLVIFAGLSALTVAPMFIFSIEFVMALGGTPGQVPFIHALRCVVELPVFIFIGTKCKATNPKKLMAIGAVLTLIFISGVFLAGTFPVLALFHALAGAPGFILLLTGRMRYINIAVPEAVRSTSITLMGTGEIAVGSIAGNLIAGYIIGGFGLARLSILSFSAILLAMLCLCFMPGKNVEKY